MRLTIRLLTIIAIALSSCAAPPRDTDIVTLHGKVIDGREASAAPKWTNNEDYTRATMGLAGVLIAQMRGTPKHYVYRVSSGEGEDWLIHARTNATERNANPTRQSA